MGSIIIMSGCFHHFLTTRKPFLLFCLPLAAFLCFPVFYVFAAFLSKCCLVTCSWTCPSRTTQTNTQRLNTQFRTRYMTMQRKGGRQSSRKRLEEEGKIEKKISFRGVGNEWRRGRGRQTDSDCKTKRRRWRNKLVLKLEKNVLLICSCFVYLHVFCCSVFSPQGRCVK